MLNTYNHPYTETYFTFSIFVSYLGLGLYMSYLYDLFFIFSLIFIVINHITFTAHKLSLPLRISLVNVTNGFGHIY